VVTRELSTALKISAKRGVRITEVLPDTSAAKAGLKVGDIITRLDDSIINASRLEDSEVFANLIRQYAVGASVALDLLRDGEPLKLTVPLDQQPRTAEGLPELTNPKFELSVRALSPSDCLDLDLKPDLHGLLVTRVEPSGWGALAGLRSNDILLTVDGAPVESTSQLEEVLAACRDRRARRVVFFVQRGIYTRFIEIEPRW
jgi:S1-C subfamily serine protease